MRRLVIGAYRIRALAYAVAVVVLVAVGLSTSAPLDERVHRVLAPLAFVALALFILSVVLMFLGPRVLPAHEVRVVSSPVRGRWLGMNSPATKVPSHGVRMYGQAYAIDLVHEPEAGPSAGAEAVGGPETAAGVRPVFGSGPAMRRPQEYPAFGQPVRSMIGGTVVRASGWRRDHRARSNGFGLVYLMVEGMVRELGGPGFILGNHVIIRGDDGEFAVLAHLQQHSLNVRRGDVVRAGQQVGRCGNSGNSSEPHVHAQLMDRPSPLTAQGLPLAFRAIVLDDEAQEQDGLPQNDQHMTASHLDRELPG
ncbi:M23 family metallopeptidase [Brevibacterium salitolerans]|uniref:M23 family metallopeptidase n=1 Tax=Brevibacterium salitolerans TaxID=1403566 RepID=UPI0031D61372